MSANNKSEEKIKPAGAFDIDQPILVLDGLLMICDVCEQTFVPEENLSFEDLIQSLKSRLLNPESPSYQPERRSLKSQFSEERNMHYSAFYKNRLRIGSDNVFDEDFCHDLRSPTRRKSSSTSIPNSILLTVTPKKSSLQESISEDDEVFVESKLQKLKEKFRDQINWVRDKGEDYVALETLDNIQEIVVLLKIFLGLKTPAALGFKINHDQTITISYQFLKNFNKDFMMLKVGENYRVFMSPF